jgi:zinc protease
MQIERVVSPGGIEAWLVEEYEVPVIVMNVSWAGGSASDPQARRGLANMVSGLLDEGAGKLDSQAFQRREDELASSLNFNASRDNFTASLRTLTKNLQPAFELLHLALAAPRFDPEPVARVRSQILIALAHREQDPNWIAGRVWWHNALKGHPYATQPDGRPETVKAITVEDLHRFIRDRLARNVLTLGVVGDITPAQLKPLLDKTFGGLPAKAAPVDIPEAEPDAFGSQLLVKKPVPQSVVTFGQPGIKRDDPDWYAALLDNYVLGGGGFTSWLTTEVREKRGLAYGVYSYLAPLRHGGLILGGVATENAQVAEALHIIRGQWQRMHDNGPTEKELEDAKTYLTGSFPLQFSSTGNIASILVDIQQNHLGIDYINRRDRIINGVTLADAKRVARRLFDPAKLSLVVVGSPQNLVAREVSSEGG